MLPLCTDRGIGVIPWSPLARGRLAREWDETTARSQTDAFGSTLYGRQETADRAVVDRVGEVAAARGVPRAQVALAWLLSKPAVTAPIVGATKQQHLDDAAAAIDLRLDDAELARLEEPYVPHERAGF
jgi:aryl-alcohol dehydrogenase (NADP+)